jgi:hypothetical protein
VRVYAGQIHLTDELDGGWRIGVVVAAVHLDAVDAVLVDRLDVQRNDNGQKTKGSGLTSSYKE